MKRFLLVLSLIIFAAVASSFVRKLTAAIDSQPIPKDKVAFTIKNDRKEPIRVFMNKEKGYLVNPGKSFTTYVTPRDTISAYIPSQNATYKIALNEKSKSLFGMELTTTIKLLDAITNKVTFEAVDFVEERGGTDFYSVVYEAVTPYGGG